MGEKSVREDSVCVSAGGVGEMEEELKTCRQFQMVKKDGGEDNDVGASLYLDEDEDDEYVDSDDSLKND